MPMKRNKPSISKERKAARIPKKEKPYKGNTETMVSTGSTLLDLAISGNRKRGGGLPGGILVEAFGPEGAGKTVLLCEIAGAIQRLNGDIMFNDPEARINKQFASMFDLDTSELTIEEPDTVTEVIGNIRDWEPKGNGKINGIMTDSLAALSTRLELDNKEGDKMGQRRAKEFSEGFRKICRILKQQNYLMVCSNQIRDKVDAMGYGEKFTTPGGKAVPFYSSVRLRLFKPEKIKKKIKVKGKEVTKVIGTNVKVEVYKNSVDAPYRTANIIIQFDYGIDDIRANLQYLKDFTKSNTYAIGDLSLGRSIEDAIQKVEEDGLETDLKDAVIDLWEEIESKFKVERKKKKR